MIDEEASVALPESENQIDQYVGLKEKRVLTKNKSKKRISKSPRKSPKKLNQQTFTRTQPIKMSKDQPSLKISESELDLIEKFEQKSKEVSSIYING